MARVETGDEHRRDRQRKYLPDRISDQHQPGSFRGQTGEHVHQFVGVHRHTRRQQQSKCRDRRNDYLEQDQRKEKYEDRGKPWRELSALKPTV